MLSHPLPVFGLVSRYLTNYLIGRSPLPRRRSFSPERTWGITLRFQRLSPTSGYVRSHYSPFRHCVVRLACFSHAASVQSEPGSNSSIDFRRPTHLAMRRIVSMKRSDLPPQRPLVEGTAGSVCPGMNQSRDNTTKDRSPCGVHFWLFKDLPTNNPASLPDRPPGADLARERQTPGGSDPQRPLDRKHPARAGPRSCTDDVSARSRGGPNCSLVKVLDRHGLSPDAGPSPGALTPPETKRAAFSGKGENSAHPFMVKSLHQESVSFFSFSFNFSPAPADRGPPAPFTPRRRVETAATPTRNRGDRPPPARPNTTESPGNTPTPSHPSSARHRPARHARPEAGDVHHAHGSSRRHSSPGPPPTDPPDEGCAGVRATGRVPCP